MAAALSAVVPLTGLVLLWLAARLVGQVHDFLFAVMPIVAGAVAVAGALLLAWGGQLVLWLLTRHRLARLSAAVTGVTSAGCGLLVLTTVSVPAGLLLVLHGGLLVWLMFTPAARRDLGGWVEPLQQPAPWGSTPGTGLWSSEPAVQGPWSPDPRTLPTWSWKGFSGPRVPWWQTWAEGLRQGIPLWELLLLVAAGVGAFLGLVAVPMTVRGSATIGTLHLVTGPWTWALPLLPSSAVLVWWLEQRMRARLARGPRR